MSADHSTPELSVAADPSETMVATLFAPDAPAKDKASARLLFSSIAGAARPWEQLPSTLKQAARSDASRVLGDKTGVTGGAADLVAAGYSALAADRLLRDLGRA